MTIVEIFERSISKPYRELGNVKDSTVFNASESMIQQSCFRFATSIPTQSIKTDLLFWIGSCASKPQRLHHNVSSLDMKRRAVSNSLTNWMKSVVGLYENRQAVGGATDPQLHSNRTVIHFKREYLVQLYYTRGRRPVAPQNTRTPRAIAVCPAYRHYGDKLSNRVQKA